MRGITTALLAGLLVAVFALPAGAVPPDRYDGSFEWSEVYVTCADFDVVVDFALDFRGSVFYDENGVAVRNAEHYKMTGLVHRGDGDGPTLVERDAWMDTFMPPDTNPFGPFVVNGVIYNLTIPGYGAVLKLSGKVIWDWNASPVIVSATGWNVTTYDLPPEARAALCGYFGDI